MDKPKSIWDLLVPLDTVSTDSQAVIPERKKIVYIPDEEISKPTPKPNPIPISTGQGKHITGLAENGNRISSKESVDSNNRPYTSAPPLSSSTQYNEFKKSGTEHKTHTEIPEEEHQNNRPANPWPVVGAIIILILIIVGTYYLNDKIKESRKKREKKEDDFIDSFFDSKTGDIVRFSGIALGLFIAAIALLHSTKILAKGIKGVQETL